MEATSVTSKGQVTIPREIRRGLGIRQGSRIAFRLKGKFAELRIVAQPAQVSTDGFGLLKTRKRSLPADFDAAALLGAGSRRK